MFAGGGGGGWNAPCFPFHFVLLWLCYNDIHYNANFFHLSHVPAITSCSLISSGCRIFRTPLLLTSGRSCHRLNLEVVFLSKLIWGTALLSTVFVASVSDGVSSEAKRSSGSLCESCSRLVSISWRVDLSRYSWYKSPRKQQDTRALLTKPTGILKSICMCCAISFEHVGIDSYWQFHSLTVTKVMFQSPTRSKS